MQLWSMYVAHHAFRRDLAAFAAVVSRVRHGDAPAWSALADRWSVSVELLHRHHRAEDAGLWPLLTRATEQAGDQAGLGVLRAMKAEHAELDPLLASSAEGLRRLADGSNGAERERVVADVSRTRDALDGHLAHEEADAVPLIQTHLIDEQWRDIERRHFVRPKSLAEVRFQVPWAVYGLSAHQREQVFAVGGRAFRLTWALTRSRFDRQERRLFGEPASLSA